MRTVWQGFYIGGQASYGSADMDFKNSGKELLERLLNNIVVEGQYHLSTWRWAERPQTVTADLADS